MRNRGQCPEKGTSETTSMLSKKRQLTCVTRIRSVSPKRKRQRKVSDEKGALKYTGTEIVKEIQKRVCNRWSTRESTSGMYVRYEG